MNSNFADALSTMCSECEEIALGMILRNIRESRGFSVRGFADYINRMDKKYQDLLGTNFTLGRIDRNIVHRWEGTESSEPSIAKSFTKKHLLWLGTILELSVVERATYDLAVICYLMFELNEQSRDICDELETQGKDFAEKGELALMAKKDKDAEMMPHILKRAGLNEADVDLWNAASAYLNNPSDETLQAYEKAREQMLRSYFEEENSNMIPQFDAAPDKRKHKVKNSPTHITPITQMNKSLLGIAAIIGIIACSGIFLLSNYPSLNLFMMGMAAPSATFTATPIPTLDSIVTFTPTPMATLVPTASPFPSPTIIPTSTLLSTSSAQGNPDISQIVLAASCVITTSDDDGTGLTHPLLENPTSTEQIGSASWLTQYHATLYSDLAPGYFYIEADNVSGWLTSTRVSATENCIAVGSQ